MATLSANFYERLKPRHVIFRIELHKMQTRRFTADPPRIAPRAAAD
jgi:hypothetical protein